MRQDNDTGDHSLLTLELQLNYIPLDDHYIK